MAAKAIFDEIVACLRKTDRMRMERERERGGGGDWEED